MAKYIDAADFVGEVLTNSEQQLRFRQMTGTEAYYEFLRLVNEMPAADVAPVVRGRWTKSEDDWGSLATITCSECHEEWCFETEEDVELLNYRYCPNCGARMDLRGGDNDE